VNFDSNHASVEKNMDDLILKAAIWQDDHWVDRSALLKTEPVVVTDIVKVVLLSPDRNRMWLSFFVLIFFGKADKINVFFFCSSSQSTFKTIASSQRERFSSASGYG
jgi:hypothetical protein